MYIVKFLPPPGRFYTLIIFLIGFFLGGFNSAQGQGSLLSYPPENVRFIRPPGGDLKPVRDGIPEGALRVIQQQNQKLQEGGRTVHVRSYQRPTPPVRSNAACGSCRSMGAETGWDVWQSEEGWARSGTTDTFFTPIAPNAPRFSITSGPGIDRFTPGVNPGDPPITVVAPPGFGQQSILLGQLETDGIGGGCSAPDSSGNGRRGCAERLTYCFNVGLFDTNFVYAYAFVMENPSAPQNANSHARDDMPYVEFLMLDANGDTLQCAYQQYIASQAFGGQYNCNSLRPSTPTATRDTPIYKPWTIVGVNLSNYIGQTLTVVLTNADCTLGGHFSHSYWDFNCGSNSAVVKPNCYPNAPDTLVAPSPPDTSVSYTYEWYLNQNPTPIGFTQIITPFSVNGDTFTVKVTSANGCDWYARYAPQHFNVSSDFTFTTQCGLANFRDSSFSPSSEDPINYWSWTFTSGNPATSVVADPDSISLPPGLYNVQLISGTYSPGCRDTMVKPVRVPQYPIADFSNVDVCAGSLVSFDNLSTIPLGDTIRSYHWTMPGGTPDTSSLKFPSSQFALADTFSVKLTVTSTRGCADSVLRSVAVHPAPLADFSVDSVCLGDTVTLVNHSSLLGGNDTLTYSWTIPGGQPSSTTVTDTSVVFNQPTSSSVMLIATSTQGCKDTVYHTAVVHPLPVAEFTTPTVCFGDSVKLINLSAIIASDSIVSYGWNLPGSDIAISNDFEPRPVYQSLDTTVASLLVTSRYGCTDSISHPVITVANPTADFVAKSICVSDSLLLENISHNNPQGEPMFYSWTITGVSPSQTTEENPLLHYTVADSSTITLVATAVGGCSDTLTQRIAVYPLPEPEFSVPDHCFGDSVQLTNATVIPSGESIDYYQWTIQESVPAASSAVSPYVNFLGPGDFDIQLTAVTDNGCRDSVTRSAHVFQLPVAAISPGDSGCVPVCHTFTDLSVANEGTLEQWSWNFPGGDPAASSDQNPGEVCYDTPGVYLVSLDIVSSTGCKASIAVDSMIRGYSLPVADFAVSTQSVGYTNPIFWFNDQSSENVVAWHWNFGDGSPWDITSGPNPYHNYASSMAGNDFYQYNTTLIVTTKYGCTDTVLRPLDVTPEFTFFIPSSFTPNADLKNNTFYGKGLGITEYEIWIFDRWGLELFYCKEEGSNVPYDKWGEEGMPASCQWDGKLFGKTVQQDVYVWKVRLTDIFGKKHSYLGRVTVYY